MRQTERNALLMHQHLLRPVTFAIVLVSRFSGHKASLLGAALAYYAVFSLGPLMVIAIAIARFVFGDEVAHGEVSAQLKNLLGDNGAQAVEAMLAGADRHHNGLVAATIGVGTLLVAAIWVVVAFKEALNTIWDVVAAPCRRLRTSGQKATAPGNSRNRPLAARAAASGS